MEQFKDVLSNGNGQPAPIKTGHAADLNRDRFETLKMVILHARLSCDRPSPDESELVALIRSWNIALVRVPTEKLMRSLQSAIENHKPGSGPISAPEIIAGYRSLRENTSPQIVKMLDTGRIEWPEEFYQVLEKLWPNYRAKKPVCLAKPQEAVIEHSMLRNGVCSICGAAFAVGALIQSTPSCIDCSLKHFDIFINPPCTTPETQNETQKP